jgi:hypothetical protein
MIIPAKSFLSKFSINFFLPILIIGIMAGNLLSSIEYVIKNYPPIDGFVLSNGELLGSDFIAFYVAGKMSVSHRELLYDFDFQKEVRKKILGNEAKAIKGELPFVHPPLVAWAFSWASSVNYDKAYYLWLAASSIISLGSLFLLIRELKIFDLYPAPIIFLGIFAFVPYSIDCLLGGQLASIGIFISSFLYILLKKRRYFLAGLISSLAYYKPAYFFLLIIALIFSRSKYFFLGLLFGNLILIACTVSYIGFPSFINYLHIISGYKYGQEIMPGAILPLQHGFGIYPLLMMFSSDLWSYIIYLAIFSVFLITAIKNLRESCEINIDFFGLAFIFAASLCLSLQLAKYDISILLVPFIIASSKYYATLKSMKWGWIVIAAFYLEYSLRGINIGGFVINAASIFFIPYLISIFYAGKEYKKTAALDGFDQKEQQ